jgi:hypothetical protein
MRYATTNQLKTPSGKRRLETTIFPSVPPSAADTFIQILTPERLDRLAVNFYDDVAAWWIIAASNNIPRGTFIVPANTVLRMPPKPNVIELIRTANLTR